MRIWLSKNSEVPIREQLVTQIVLGIVSNDLKLNERLPSTQEAVRRSFSLQRPDHFLLLESDPELREILVAEIESAAKVKVKGAGTEDPDGQSPFAGATPMR